MVYVDRYNEFLTGLPRDIARAEQLGKRIVFGYTSNLDVVLDWDTNVFSSILQDHLPGQGTENVGDRIGSLGDFARIVSPYVFSGLGGEVDITNPKVCEYLENSFFSSLALGGTAAQGAAALGAIGFPVLVHLTDSSREVCRLLNYPTVAAISRGGLSPVFDVATNVKPTKHFILQYDRGEVISISEKTYVVPASNRLIMDYDLIHKNLPIQSEFLNYVVENASDFYSYSVSGFNLVVEAQVLDDRLRELEKHYAQLKEVNSACIIYLESAHYLNVQIRQSVFRRLAPYIDILGVNEEELADLVHELGGISASEDFKPLIAGLKMVIDHYFLRGIVLHTKDYALYYGQELMGLDVEKGLTLGNLLAGTKARIGDYGSQADCQATLALDLSPQGLDLAKQVAKLKTDQYVCIVPSRYISHPASTVGLGDCFVAGMQLAFVQ